ncbi:MAG: ATP-binding cassette domain-containing protein [Pseudomonadota bacterium]
MTVYRGKVVALQDISFTLPAGQTLAVVGESGAGKSTLIATILGLIKPSQGKITWNGEAVRKARPTLVMQEPRSAFNPALSLWHSVMEPVIAQRKALDHPYLERLCRGLELPLDLLDRLPHQVSIGQAQRIGILRALLTSPEFVLFDEPLSALDAVTQKHTARLIAHLQAEGGFAALIVTHDLGYAAAYGDEIIVLRNGRLEEVGPARAFVAAPQTEYGVQLRDAALALGALERAP